MAFLGYTPLLAPKTSDSAEIRLRKIYELIETSSVGIHDLSRSKASVIGEYYRLNMPFELGILATVVIGSQIRLDAYGSSTLNSERQQYE